MRAFLETLSDFLIGVVVFFVSGMAIINPLINHFLAR